MAVIIVLQSSDNRHFKLDVEVAKMSTLIKEMLENLGDPEEGKEEIIPVQVEGHILEKVLEWAINHHKLNESGTAAFSEGACVNDNLDNEENDNKNTERSEWNQKFFEIENEILFAVTRAANYLDMKQLLELCCKSVANRITGKEPLQVRELFGFSSSTIEKKEKRKTQKTGKQSKKRKT